MHKSNIFYLKAPTPSKDKVSERNPDILVDNLAMTLRCIVVTEDSHRADYLNARCVCGNYDHALLVISICVVGVTLSHDQVKFCPGISCSTDPPEKNMLEDERMLKRHSVPLMTIYDNFIALPAD